MALLENIKASFNNEGDITTPRKGVVKYRIRSIKGLKEIINHFDKYPLISKKLADYELFKQVYSILENNKYLTLDNFIKIVSIKASINKGGLSDGLTEAFPNIIPFKKSLVRDIKIPDPN